MNGFLAGKGTRSVDWYHRSLAPLLDYCGMARNRPVLRSTVEIPALYREFKTDARVLGTNNN